MADQVLQEIKDRLNVADVIASYIQVKKSGVNFKAVCPFHHEKTASLMISPSKQIWHCFGCNEGGDAFGFVMRYENLEFRDALKILADKAGVVLPVYSKSRQDTGEKELLLRINAFAARFYHQILISDKRGVAALKYLQERGLTLETVKKWQIGFAPEDFHALEQALSQKSVKAEDLVKAGVSVKNEQGKIYDRFRGRITFPIFNYFAEVVGFSARILKDDAGAAKYVNSPETAVYNKSKILFGLNFAKNEIRKLDEAVLVEGQMDCIASHQVGINNVIATSGTALTGEHLNLLSRLSKNLKFCFDADSAGQAAARRAGELALASGFNVKLIALFGAKDPDELLKQNPQLWQEAIRQAVWFIDYYIERALKNFTGDAVAQGKELNQTVLPLLAAIADPLERHHYVKILADKLGTPERAVLEALQKAASGAKPAVYNKPDEIAQPSPAQPNLQLEKLLLGGIQVLPEFLEFMRVEGKPEDFPEGDTRQLFEVLIASQDRRTAEQAQAVNSTLAKEAAFMVESQLESLDGNTEALLRELKKNFYLLKLSKIKFEQQRLAQLIKQAEDQRRAELLAQYNEQFAQLSNSRMEYENLL